MEIIIKNPIKVIFAAFLMDWTKVFASFVGAFLLGVVVGLAFDNPYIWLLIFLVLPLIYISYKIFNTKTFALHTKIQQSENSVEFISGNLMSNSNIHIPFGQIQGASVTQSFVMKILGIAAITVTDEKGLNTTLWGFDKHDADLIAKEISKKSQERVQIS